ncbi:MAG: S-adenosylmethionine decarboxylase proenzyme [Candidatus Aminicenantes bacterium]|nr:MAG: S-adenosylmethionine decarboxylase proenzyme [Candidatus Aminicenantes bacterium]
MQSLGNHLIVELYDCPRELINDAREVEDALVNAVNISGARVVQSVVHEFNPHGISGVVVIEESHFSVHTWPEYGYCALDIFTCGEEIDYYSALHYLKKEFQAKHLSVTEMKRGMLDLPVKLLHKPNA